MVAPVTDRDDQIDGSDRNDGYDGSDGSGQDDEDERAVEELARRMDGPITVLGVVFLLLVLGETTMGDDGDLRPWFELAGWVLWALFAAELVVRTVAAPSPARYLRRNWWQVIFLALPFLRFLRVAGRLARLRPARVGRLLSSAVRGVRTAGRTLTGRLATLTASTVVVVLSASQILFAYAGYDSYAAALHDATYSTVAGEPLPADSAVADVLELVLALYAVLVFAFLAGSLGAFFLERSGERTGACRPAQPDADDRRG